ncbi:hypothetical protein CRE_21156 [Caenorhabditis remanei]|uniref:Uncharacterized protein n=1 Tax=Caenorhabditis remanei TaxID=31234 RepID=E3MF14_CAERE|nr:hypothetical protein CRE_21156 [Caenorhabditis remanei]
MCTGLEVIFDVSGKQQILFVTFSSNFFPTSNSKLIHQSHFLLQKKKKMMSLEIPLKIASVAFALSLLSNSLLIYITVRCVKKVTGSYRRMIIQFSILAVIFPGLQIVVKPFSHNFKECMMFFSLNTSGGPGLQFSISVWVGLSTSIISLIAVQFVYRYLSFLDVEKARKFENLNTPLFWILYPFVPGSLYTASLYFLCQPDSYSDDYMINTIQENYSLNITNQSRFTILPFGVDGNLRWLNCSFIISATLLIFVHYVIIIFCGVKIYRYIKKELGKFSAKNMQLQQQFFCALVIQSLGPTVLLVFKVSIFLLFPLLAHFWNIDLSYQTGWFCSVAGLFPIVDSVAFMIIVSEYRLWIIKKFSSVFVTNHSSVSHSNGGVEIVGHVPVVL